MTLPQTVKYGYFSPTENTRKVARALAEGACRGLALTAPPIPLSWLTPADRSLTDRLHFIATDLAIIGFPVYAGRLPNLLLPFVAKLRGEETPAIALVTFGFRNYDDALAELGAALTNQGFKLLAALAVPAAHSFSNKLGSGHPNAQELAALSTFGDRLAFALKAGRPVRKFNLPFKNTPPIYFQPRRRDGEPINILKVKPKLRAGLCTHCGRCAAACPMQVINPDNPAEIKSPCIKCSACRKVCPTDALYFDDPGFLYHVKDLETSYDRPCSPSIFKFIET